MANNEVNTVPAANDTTSSGSSTGPAAGPLAVSESNPRAVGMEVVPPALGAPSTFGDRIHRSVGASRSARSGVLRRPPRSQAVLGSSAKGA